MRQCQYHDIGLEYLGPSNRHSALEALVTIQPHFLEATGHMCCSDYHNCGDMVCSNTGDQFVVGTSIPNDNKVDNSA